MMLPLSDEDVRTALRADLGLDEDMATWLRTGNHRMVAAMVACDQPCSLLAALEGDWASAWSAYLVEHDVAAADCKIDGDQLRETLRRYVFNLNQHRGSLGKAAVDFVAEHHAEVASLRANLEAGMAQLNRGEAVSAADVFAELRRRLARDGRAAPR